MRELYYIFISVKFEVDFVKILSPRAGFHKIACEMAWANAISIEFEEIFIKLLECGPPLHIDFDKVR